MKSLFSKIFVSTAAIMLLSSLALGAVLYYQLYRYSLNQTSDRLSASAERLSTATSIWMESPLLTEKMFRMELIATAAEQSSSVLIADTSGNIVFYADPTSYGSGTNMKSVDLPIVNGILLGNVYNDIGDLNGYYRNKVFTVGVPIVSTANGANVGVVLVSTPADEQTGILSDVFSLFIITSAAVLCVVFLITYFVVRGMTRPLKKMNRAVKDFALGNFDTRINLSGKDEIAALGAAFDNMAVSLQKTEQVRQDFVANVSHELKTPMTTIAGFVDGIRDGTIPPERQDYYLDIISSEVRRLSRLVSRTLFASRLQSGAQELNLARLDVCEIIRRVVLGFEQHIDEKHLAIGVDIPDKPLFVMADLDAITQVIYNLTDNAVKYSNESGKVRISAAAAQGGKVRVEIFNTGNGIPAEDTAFVFDRFYKSDRSRGESKESFGLGLYIVKAIVNRHGETISVCSVPGQSCAFCFTLQAAEDSDEKLLAQTKTEKLE